MNAFDLIDRPDPAQVEAERAEIAAFREQHRTLGTAALAIAFIEQRGSATSTELSVLLGLAADEYPSVVLRSSVQGERLACTGRVWTLGPKAVPSTREQERPKDVPRFAGKNADQPLKDLKSVLRDPEVMLAPAIAPTEAPAQRPVAKPSLCKFAFWSDGQVEIRKTGQPPLELSSAEFHELVGFVTKANHGHVT